VTSPEQLETLRALGFSRVSFGIQDFDPKIQEIINRPQDDEQIAAITTTARELGYSSINFDYVYGLPLQTKACIIHNVEKTKILRPDRIAFYSYAHVPWVSPGQQRYTEKDLPLGEAKRALYELGRDLLEEAGYVEIGMDHFALPSDALYTAAQQQTLHRNFMGYTPTYTKLQLGLGVSSISDSWGAFMQNNKVFEDYVALVEAGQLPILRGHVLSKEDLVLRRHILNIMCHFQTHWRTPERQHPTFFQGLERMAWMEADGLVEIFDDRLQVTETGRTFIRNICMALDARLWRKQPETQLFSQVI